MALQTRVEEVGERFQPLCPRLAYTTTHKSGMPLSWDCGNELHSKFVIGAQRLC